MSGEVLTTNEKNAILALMAETKEIANVDLKAIYGVSLHGKARERLNELKMVASRKVGRTYHHELLDAGWARCREELTVARPPRSNIALYAVLTSLDRYLQRTRLSLADVFAQPVASIEESIVIEYRRLARRRGAQVRLAALRAQLGGFAKGEVDEALLRLADAGRIRLAPNDDQKNVKRPDREAAVRFGDRTNHLLSIEAT